jgi:peptidoglycan L-alanyl-D-glutamate endopeptidase CwlK
MINSRRLSDLRPRTQAKALDMQTKCAAVHKPILIYSTLRDEESQNSLYALGRTLPGKIVTNAVGGDSFHQYRVAFDFVPLVNGQPAWGDFNLYRECAEIGKACGLEWGGDFKSIKDMPHMQDTGGYSIADYKAGKVPT